MNIPKIPAWALPWVARRRLAELEAQRDDALRSIAEAQQGVSQAVQKTIATEMAHEETKATVVKLQKAVGGLTRWIFVTHRIDQRADDHGLKDILTDFPPMKQP